jgi:hypothetical protein
MPGATGGTWGGNGTNLASIQVDFTLAASADRTGGTANSWIYDGSQRNNLAGQTNLVATVGNTWHVTGVQLEAGTVPTSFELRSYSKELMMCQRYYYDTVTSSGSGFATTGFVAAAGFPVTMRTSPTVTMFYSGTQNRIYTISNAALVTMTPTILSGTTAVWAVYDTGISTLGVGTGYLMNFKCNAEL